MSGIIIAIILVAALILTFAVMGVGGDLWNKIDDSLRDRINKQSEQSDPDVSTQGSFANDPVFDTNGDGVGDRDVCNLKLQFVGLVQGHHISNDFDLFQGTYLRDVNLGIFGDFTDMSKVKYTWFCPTKISPLDLIGFNLSEQIGNPQVSSSLAPNNILEAGETFDITFWAEGESKVTGKSLIASQFEKGSVTTGPFHKSQTVSKGTPLPSDYAVTIWLYGVTEDDYDLTYWNSDAKINGENANHRWHFDICSETSLAGLSLLRTAGGTNPHTTTSTTNSGDTVTTTTSSSGATTTTVEVNPTNSDVGTLKYKSDFVRTC
jgi:hypothetical protein